jgi:hypothetical protein
MNTRIAASPDANFDDEVNKEQRAPHEQARAVDLSIE